MIYLIAILLASLVILLMLVLGVVYKGLAILNSIHEGLGVSDSTMGDVNFSGSGGLADVLLRKIWDLEKRMSLLQDIYEKLELIHEWTGMSPEEKEKIFKIRRLAADLKGKE